MKTALRALAGVLAGLVVTAILLVAVELFSAVVHPFPEDFDGTTEEMCRHVERYPPWVLAVAVPAWAAAAFAGTWTAKKIGNLIPFAIVSVLVLAAVVFNISVLPYPMWFKVASLLAIPVAIVVGGRLATRGKTTGMV